jgi:hypothetical protein
MIEGRREWSSHVRCPDSASGVRERAPVVFGSASHRWNVVLWMEDD